MKNYFSLSKFTNGTRIEGKQLTILILYFIMLFHAKKRVLINGRPLLDQDNNVIAAVVTLRDISKYKQLEQKNRKNTKLIGLKGKGRGRRNKGRRRL
jgi:hypothetical protein